MAGIQEAQEKALKGEDEGVVVAIGITIDHMNYLIIKLHQNKGFITQFDYGSDLKFEEGIKVGDIVVLEVNDYDAIWKKVE